MRDDYEDGDYDFPPAEHPGRELFTMSLFALCVLAFVVWAGWKLFAWL